MTTKQRAAYLNGNREFKKLRLAFPKKPNSNHKIDSIKGLKIQSFFSDLVEGVADMELILAEMNPYRDEAARAEYDRVTGLIRGLEQAFLNAGYSNKGNPYWADVSGPNDRQVRDIISAAMACLPVFHERSQALLKNMGQNPKDQKAFYEFTLRFGKFDSAITGFKDHLSHQRYARDQILARDALPMCALA